MSKPELLGRLGAMGLEPQTSSPEGLATVIRTEITRWERVIKEGKLRSE